MITVIPPDYKDGAIIEEEMEPLYGVLRLYMSSVPKTYVPFLLFGSEPQTLESVLTVASL